MSINGNEIVKENKDFQRGREPKILYLDLEVSPMLMWAYSAYEANALKIKLHPQIVSFSWQWESKNTIHARVLSDYDGYCGGISNLNDKNIVTELHEIMGDADVIITHNGKKFDIPIAKSRFIFHGLPVQHKYIVEDTLFIARKYFRFPKNNLDELCEQFGIGTKTKVKHSDIIWDCIEGDAAAWEALRKYNRNDILLTRKLYKKLGPWHETHANLNFFRRKERCCPFCGSKNTQSRGLYFGATVIKHKYVCVSCGRWWRGEKIEKEYDTIQQSNP